jgi:hypothetical protein
MSIRVALCAWLALTFSAALAMADDADDVQHSPRLAALPLNPEFCKAGEGCHTPVRPHPQARLPAMPSTPALAAMHPNNVRKDVIVPNSSPAKKAANPAPADPALLAAFEQFIKRKRCDRLMDHCYDSCKAAGTAPSQCNQLCTADTQCGWDSKQTYGEYLDQQIEALAARPLSLAKLD